MNNTHVKRPWAAILVSVVFFSLAFTSMSYCCESDDLNCSKFEKEKKNLLGVFGSIGIALSVGPELPYIGGDNAGPRLAGGGGITYDRFLNNWLSLMIGVGLIGKGFSVASTEDNELQTLYGIDEYSYHALYLEIPLGVSMSLHHLRFRMAIALNVGLSEKIVSASDFGGKGNWNSVNRFNFGPKLSIEYEIPIKILYLTPGVDWSMHLLTDNSYSTTIDYYRRMNVMFNLAIQYPF